MDESHIKHDLDKITDLTARETVYNYYAKNPKPSFQTSSRTNTDSSSCGGSSGFNEDPNDTFNATFDTTFDTTYDTYESIDHDLYLQTIDDHNLKNTYQDSRTVPRMAQDCSTPRQPEYVNDPSEIKSFGNPRENQELINNESPKINQPKPIPRKSFFQSDKMRSVSEELNERFAKNLKKSQSESALQVQIKTMTKITHRVLYDFEADQYCAAYNLDEFDFDEYLTVKENEFVQSNGIDSNGWVVITNEIGKSGKIPFSYVTLAEK